MDILEDVTAARWTGSSFQYPATGATAISANTEVLNSAQESAMFDWSRYDLVPNVTNVMPSAQVILQEKQYILMQLLQIMLLSPMFLLI